MRWIQSRCSLTSGVLEQDAAAGCASGTAGIRGGLVLELYGVWLQRFEALPAGAV